MYPSKQSALQANKAAFFFRLERELEKVNSFYLQKEGEVSLLNPYDVTGIENIAEITTESAPREESYCKISECFDLSEFCCITFS